MITQKEILKSRKIFTETDQDMARVFKALSEVNRFRIFRILAEQPLLSVGNIASILNISLPLTSQHIRVLAHANLIQKERAGKKVVPRLKNNNPFVQTIVKTIQKTIELSK